MTKVVIDKGKIDILANAISAKSGESLTMTLDEMVEAVDGIQTGGGITPTGNIDITQAGVTDVTNYATATVSDAEVDLNVQSEFYTESGNRKWHYRAVASTDGNDGWYSGGTGTYITRNAVASGTVVTPTTSAQTLGGANYMMEGAVTVAAMPSGSVTAPSTISGSSATVSTGTNTLTLSKTVSVTPNVTTAGYVSAGTAGNSNVSLTASVTTQAAQTIYPSTSDQTIASGRYLTGTQTVKAVTTTNLTADNIKSGVTVQIGDSSDSDRVASVTGTYGGGGSSMNVQTAQSTTRSTSTSGSNVISLTCSTAGTYTVRWSTFRSSTSGTWGSRLYIGGTAYENMNTAGWSNHIQNREVTGVSISKNQAVAVYVQSRGSNYYGYVGTLTIIQTA